MVEQRQDDLIKPRPLNLVEMARCGEATETWNALVTLSAMATAGNKEVMEVVDKLDAGYQDGTYPLPSKYGIVRESSLFLELMVMFGEVIKLGFSRVKNELAKPSPDYSPPDKW